MLPPHPLDHPGVVKLLLSQAASDALAELGPFHLILASKADCTAPPEAQGRFVLICQPLDKATADDAAAVALGRKRAAKIRKGSARPPTPANHAIPAP
jgi:hypothetical protein